MFFLAKLAVVTVTVVYYNSITTVCKINVRNNSITFLFFVYKDKQLEFINKFFYV